MDRIVSHVMPILDVNGVHRKTNVPIVAWNVPLLPRAPIVPRAPMRVKWHMEIDAMIAMPIPIAFGAPQRIDAPAVVYHAEVHAKPIPQRVQMRVLPHTAVTALHVHWTHLATIAMAIDVPMIVDPVALATALQALNTFVKTCARPHMGQIARLVMLILLAFGVEQMPRVPIAVSHVHHNYPALMLQYA